MLGIETVKITPEILKTITEIDEFKGLWTGLEKYTTGLNLIGDVAAYGQAFHKALGPLKDRPIDKAVLQILHAGLGHKKERQDFRQNEHMLDIIKDGTTIGTLETAQPDQISPLLDKLLEWTQATFDEKKLHPLVIIAVFIAIFLQICPFEEHNQKLARLLITLLMLKAGYSYAPYIPLDSIMNERADITFHALRHNQSSLEEGRPNWSEWLRCFLTLLQHQKNTLHNRLENKSENLSHLPTLSAKILALFEQHNRLQMKDIIKLTNGRRATIKLRLSELVQSGILKRHGQARATWYSLV